MNELKQLQAKQVLPIVSIVTFLGFLDTHLLIPIIALYASELEASPAIIGLIIGLYSLTNTPANILFGRLIDRIGYKIPLIAGLIGDALSMFLYSLSRLPVHLALVRVLHGTTGASIGPATMSVTAGYGGEGQKGRAMSFYGMSLATATLVGYGLSGILASRLGYKAVFLFGAAMLIIGAILSLWLPGSIRQGSNRTKTSPGGGFEKVKDLFKRKGLIVAYSSIFAQYFTFGGVVTLLPLYVKGLGMEAFHVGMLMAIFAIMFIIIQLPSGALSDRVGRLIPAVSGLGLGIVSLVILPSVTVFSLLAVAMVFYGTAYGLLFPSISALVADHTSPEERGMATGIFHALLTAGVAIGAPTIGWLGGMVGVELGLALSSGIMVLALVIVLRTMKQSAYQRRIE
ncbi:Inner membrane transport protein YajR [subsurface metagenome]